MYWSIYSLQKTSQHSLMTAVSKGRSLEKKCFREFWTVLHRGCLQVKYAIKKWKLVKMKQGARWTFICLLTFAQALKREFCWFRKILCLTIPNSFAKSLEKEKFQGEGLGWGGVIWGWGYLMCPPPPLLWLGWVDGMVIIGGVWRVMVNVLKIFFNLSSATFFSSSFFVSQCYQGEQ